MHLLLSNDDGYQASGLRVLAQVLSSRAKITVVAPDRDRSGASNSLTLDVPLRPKLADNGFIYVNGTPTDCIHLAITGLLQDPPPDMVVSGINSGANLGDDVLYSGTVAAAMEGRFLGRPAIAVSLVGENPRYFQTAAQVVERLIEVFFDNPSCANLLLNVNVPDVPYDALNGFEVTRLGHRHKSEPVIKSKDARGKEVYWVGPVGQELDGSAGTDFHAIRRGCVSITPLRTDLTHHDLLDQVRILIDQGIET